MGTDPATLEALPPYRVRTHNASEQSENRMHSDEVVRQFGFEGALVPGVTVFAHMTRPLVERFGEAWLGASSSEVSFSKPAYEGDLLSVSARADATGAGYELTCTNAEGIELARMSSHIPASCCAVDSRSATPPAAPSGERPLVAFHRPLRVGPAYEVRAIPEQKWERKGHQFVRLYVAIRSGEATLAEIVHTAIFNPRRTS